jgi:hypothetical protein
MSILSHSSPRRRPPAGGTDTTTRRLATAAVLTIGSLLVAACGGSDDTSRNGATGSGAGRGTTASTTSSAPSGSTGAADLTSILQRAVSEERHAEATYRNVIASLGQVRPFTNIANSEAQHVAALERLAAAHDVDISAVTPAGEVSPVTKAAACQLGIDAEKADIALYDELLPQVSGNQDVTEVFQNLRAASQDNHLPAFERCR